jgi:deoxyhypusine synthase
MKKDIKNLVGGRVKNQPILGNETTGELFEKAFGSYVGRDLRTAYQIIRRMIKEDHTIVMTMSGAMTPIDFATSCIIPMIKAGYVDIFTTTGANIYHDLQRIKSQNWFEVDPNIGDIKLRRQCWTRIYDTAFQENDLFITDMLATKLVQRRDFNHSMTTTEFHNLLGKNLKHFVKKSSDLEGSLLFQAYKNHIPIFCGAPQDGSIFLNLALLKRRLGNRYKLQLDLEKDIHEFGAYHYLAKKRWSKKLSIIMLGGGVPKNYSLQPEPYLSQICGVDVGGYDMDVQICDAHLQNGGLSSCTASEAHTWGKTSKECLKNSQYVFADVTSTFPFIVHALLQEGLKRKSRNLLNFRDEAINLLNKAIF